MFYISIDGQIKNKNAVHNFVNDVLCHFFKNRMKRDIDVNVRIRKLLPDNDMGLCDGDADEVNIDLAKGYWNELGEYALYDYDELIITLAHELTHAKQFIRGEMSPYDGVWRSNHTRVNGNRMKYENRPWEKEAFENQEMLYETYWNK